MFWLRQSQPRQKISSNLSVWTGQVLPSPGCVITEHSLVTTQYLQYSAMDQSVGEVKCNKAVAGTSSLLTPLCVYYILYLSPSLSLPQTWGWSGSVWSQLNRLVVTSQQLSPCWLYRAARPALNCSVQWQLNTVKWPPKRTASAVQNSSLLPTGSGREVQIPSNIGLKTRNLSEYWKSNSLVLYLPRPMLHVVEIEKIKFLYCKSPLVFHGNLGIFPKIASFYSLTKFIWVLEWNFHKW